MTTVSPAWRAPRSWLYVPGHDERKLQHATGLAADALVFDLEDAVPANSKVFGRAATGRALRDLAFAAEQLWVRINSPASGHDWAADTRAVIGSGVTGLVLPKAGPDEVVAVAELLKRERAHNVLLAPIVTEHVRGYFAMPQTLTASAMVAAAFWGSEDLAADLGLASARDEEGRLDATLLHVRSAFLLACRAAGVAAVDTPWLSIDDLDGLAADARRSYRGGFAGMQAIHPCHVAVIEAAFTPSEEELAHAREVLLAADSAAGGATRVGAQMIDAPHMRSARRTLDLAEGRRIR